MIDLELDLNTHDLILENFSFKVVATEQVEITQRLKMKLLWFKGDWPHNENYGIDYRNKIFAKGIDLDDIDDTFRVAITSEAGVKQLLSYSSSFDRATRVLNISVKILTDSGEIINTSFSI
jgi:hypothetical protein